MERTVPDHDGLQVDRSDVSSCSVGVSVVDGGGVDGEVAEGRAKVSRVKRERRRQMRLTDRRRTPHSCGTPFP